MRLVSRLLQESSEQSEMEEMEEEGEEARDGEEQLRSRTSSC